MNKNWIEYPLVLDGNTIRLVSLETSHYDALFELAKDKRLWEHIPTDCSDRKTFNKVYNSALEQRLKGNHYPFVIQNKRGELIGSTRFFEIFPEDKKLEIGWTWIIQKYWGTVVNLECKLLLLSYCFEKLGIRRVQIKTDANNVRSRKAIEKIGGHFEGILRKDKIKSNGESRSAAYYSIIDEEWVDKKRNLELLIKKLNLESPK